MTKIKINDFGNKIGGAKKDLYRLFTMDELVSMSDMERAKHINKKEVWGKTDYQAMYDSGEYDRFSLMYYKLVKDSIRSGPLYGTLEEYEKYIRFVQAAKAAVEGCHHFAKDYVTAQESLRKCYLFVGLADNKFRRAVGATRSHIINETVKKEFLYTDEEKLLKAIDAAYTVFLYTETENGKWNERTGSGEAYFTYHRPGSIHYCYTKGKFQKEDFQTGKYFVMKGASVIAINFGSEQDAFEYAKSEYLAENPVEKKKSRKEEKLSDKIPYLDHLERTGPELPVAATPELFQSMFGFYGVEFGNWTTDRERPENLRLSMEAFYDLASVLGIETVDVSLNSTLGIAFGARGSGKAYAHYEPAYKVINLTRKKGAGSLGHEFGHAMDHYLMSRIHPDAEKGITLREMKDGMFFLSTRARGTILEPVMKVISSAHKYNQDALRLDSRFHANKPYYFSTEEMFARAFACYLKDKLAENGRRNDYLCGHADVTKFPRRLLELSGDGFISASPEGDERIRINAAFDAFFTENRTLLVNNNQNIEYNSTKWLLQGV